MQRSNFDFDVITGPVPPRAAPNPEPQPPKPKPGVANSEPRSENVPQNAARSH
jgi:hypothetical protein